jgi:hypothetical protein
MYFGIGFHKTGTTSLTEAFNRLGIPAIHHPYAMYAEHRQGKTRFDAFGDKKFVSDGIVYLIYPELDRAYPDAKFILTRRNPRDWVESVRTHFEKGHAPRADLGGVSLWDRSDADRHVHGIHEMAYGRRDFNEAVFLERYERHNREAVDYFRDRPDDLLVMDIDRDGMDWKPLCDFVGKEAPQEEFPHLRKTAESDKFFVPRR